MQKSNIEWTEFTSNPVKGECPVGCSYCYVKPFRSRYGWHSDIRFHPRELEGIRRRRKPTRIFMGSTIELFHEKTIQYMPEIIDTVRACPQHTFQFLTKQPQNLIKFSPFPENARVGVTVTRGTLSPETDMLDKALKGLSQIEAKVKYLSLEPLLEWKFQAGCHGLQDFLEEVDWLIIGACTGTYKEMYALRKRYGLPFISKLTPTRCVALPKIEWVKEIVEAADKAGVKVFLKDNLRPLLTGYPEFWDDIPQGDHPNCDSIAMLRQELPE